jgi:diadenosine tetraphosphate (Ap4A) HIT family hydrolase
MFVAQSADDFRHLFVESLRDMLSPVEAGTFVLVLANSLQDERIRSTLEPDLASVFDSIQTNIRQGAIAITDDDLAVFNVLQQTGIDSLGVWVPVVKGGWEVNFNPVRALRPLRASADVFNNISLPFDEDAFNFNKPFLRAEILWEGAWQQKQLRVLYNKFPFAPYHLIIVPDAELKLPQYLTAEYHELIWQLVDQQQTVLPGFAVGYNSLGACASVNQLHFQSFVREAMLPIEQPVWKHNAGSNDYPVRCHVLNNRQDSWALISEYHANNQAYNLLYRPGCCYVIPRMAQGSDTVLPRVRGAGWIEECGVFNVSDKAELESVSATELDDCLRSLSVSAS